MKNKLKLLLLLILVVNQGFAQQRAQASSTPANETSSKTGVSKKAAPKDVAPSVPEGKKGLNAVNVRTAKQSESSVKGQSSSPPVPAPGSKGNTEQDKHAINTKGTGATRDVANKVN